MTRNEEEIYRHVMKIYKDQWDRNDYNRTNHDDALEYYVGYRNANKYPLAYNETFNRLLPLIYTILSRFMDQLYQTGNIISVKPRKKADVMNAKAVESVLNFQMENMNAINGGGGSYDVMLKWFFNALTFGKGIMKAYWRKEDRISPRRMVKPIPLFDNNGRVIGMDMADYITMETQTVYDQPYLEVLHNKCFVPHPEYKSIQEMPGVFCVYKRSMDYVRKMAEKGEWKNIDELMPSKGGASLNDKDSREAFAKSLELEGMLEFDNPQDERMAQEVDIVEGYLRMIVEDEPYEVGSGIKIKGKEEEVIVHIGNYSTLLSLQRNIYGIRPFFDIGCYLQPEVFWDIGIIHLAKGIQEQINNMANLRMQNAVMQINQMIRVSPDSDIDPKMLVWRPFGIIPAEQGEVEPMVVPDYHSNMFMEQEQFLENTVQDLAGIYGYNKGEVPKRAERVGVVYGIQSMGEARAKLMLMSMDHMGIRPLLKYMMLLNTFHLPSGFEYRVSDGENQNFSQIFGDDIHPDFDFAARYTAMEPALGKQMKLQNLVQLYPLLSQSPWLNQQQWIKTILELTDIKEADFLVKTPEQMAQEMQQQLKSTIEGLKLRKQMEAESQMMIARGETQKDLTQSIQDFKEETILNEQEFQHDKALEKMKLDAASKKTA